MSGKGISLTRVVLVIVMLGALFFVSRIVTPPPPGPPPAEETAESKPAGASDKVDPAQAAKMKTMREQGEKAMRAQMMAKMKEGAKNRPPKSKDPNAIDTTNEFFATHSDGEQGMKQTDEEVARAKAEMAKARGGKESLPNKPVMSPLKARPQAPE